MLNPIWVGRFQVSGPRDNPYFPGFGSAYVWVVARAEDEPALVRRVTLALEQQKLAVTAHDRLQQVGSRMDYPMDVHSLVREARRQDAAILFGEWRGFEDYGHHRPIMLELRTKRLLLRPFKPADREPFARMNADREVMHFLRGPMSRAQSDKAVDRYLADFHTNGFGLLVAEELTTHAFAGVMGLQIMQDILPKIHYPAVELLWRIPRDFQRLGFATEGGKALLELAFRDFMLDEVNAVVSVANIPARRMMEKLGLKHRSDLEYNHPRFPAQELYATHTVYQLPNPNPDAHIQALESIFKT